MDVCGRAKARPYQERPWLHGRQGGIGGLGSSHTVPFGAAVPARPPTRPSHVTRAVGVAQWFGRASVQGTGVVVQGGHFGNLAIYLNGPELLSTSVIRRTTKIC